MCIRDRTYTVSVSVVPKEYTEDTKTSVFFGTNEIPLELDGIKYTGEATLPLSEDYAGNVTFLFVDGNKRSTEAVSYTHLDVYKRQNMNNYEFLQAYRASRPYT